MKKFLITILIVLLAVGSAFIFYNRKGNPNHYEKDTTPTFYFHGWSGTANSTNNMIIYAEKHSGAKKVFKATVDPSGNVKLDGSWDGEIDKPIIQVVLEDNKNGDLETLGAWYANVIQEVNKVHPFEEYNTVSHSMSNSVLQYMLLDNTGESNFPKMKKEVFIAAPINGVIGMNDEPNQNKLDESGKPEIITPNYQYFMDNVNRFPKNQIEILNIYGNLDDGSNSDGGVTVEAAKSLKYLADQYALSYKEEEFKGGMAQHSLLHHNSKVDKAINSFLWQNSEDGAQ